MVQRLTFRHGASELLLRSPGAAWAPVLGVLALACSGAEPPSSAGEAAGGSGDSTVAAESAAGQGDSDSAAGAPGESGAGDAALASAGAGALGGSPSTLTGPADSIEAGQGGSGADPSGGAGATTAPSEAGGPTLGAPMVDAGGVVSRPDESQAGSAAGAAAELPAPDPENLAPLELTNLEIVANPKMSLSCFVTWTTSEPANSEVQFGVGGYDLRIVDDALVTEHRVHVLGMHPETAYDLKAISTNAAASGSAEGAFTTGGVPDGLPEAGDLFINQPEKVNPGWTLTNFQVGGSSNFSTVPGIIVIVDEAGIPVWYFVHGSSADQFGMTSTDWLPNGHVLIGNASNEPAREVDLEGNILWEGPTGGNPSLSHHTSKLTSGNYLVVRESNSSARVEEIAPDNSVVWTWDLYDYVQPKTTAADWCHLNSVSVNAAEDVLYFNCRFQGLFKVDRASKDLLWQMGAAIDDSHSGDIAYLPDNSARFNDSHDPEVHADGTVLFYDNQGWSSHTGGEGNGSYHSRIVEYALDEATLEATLTFEFPGDFDVDPWFREDWATPIWGDADRLDNGNYLVTAGVRGAGTHTRIFEVTPDGEVVWGIEWPENNGSYRADRIQVPGLGPVAQ